MARRRAARQGFWEPWGVSPAGRGTAGGLAPGCRMVWVSHWVAPRGNPAGWGMAGGEHAGPHKIKRLQEGQTKTGRGRLLALEGAMQGVLHRRLIDKRSCPWVFHRGRPQDNALPISAGARRRACEVSGNDGKLFHDFLRTAVRNMGKAGVPERIVMEITGHKTRSRLDRDNIVRMKRTSGRGTPADIHADMEWRKWGGGGTFPKRGVYGKVAPGNRTRPHAPPMGAPGTSPPTGPPTCRPNWCTTQCQ